MDATITISTPQKESSENSVPWNRQNPIQTYELGDTLNYQWFVERHLEQTPSTTENREIRLKLDKEFTLFQGSLGEIYKIEEALFSLQKYKIEIVNIPEVREFLTRCPDFAEIVPLICELTREGFESAVQLSLEVYSDPEIDDKHLTINVRQNVYDEDFMDKINAISKKCNRLIKEHMGRIQRNLNWAHITTDFCNPL